MRGAFMRPGTITGALTFLIMISAAYSQPKKKVVNEEEKKQEKIYYWQMPGFQEEFVDDENTIYQQKIYQGIVPDLRDAIPELRVPKGKNFVTWIGYQHKKLYSRIFIQTSKIARFIVYLKSPRHIVINIKKTPFANSNTRRAIHTYTFNTKIKSIIPKKGKGGSSLIHIHLKEPGGFLYKQAGNYIFVDIEKTVSQ